MSGARSPAASRSGVLAVLPDPAMVDLLQSCIRERQFDDEVFAEATLDAALRRVREGLSPRLLIVDLEDCAAPISEISAARAVGGAELRVVAVGRVNDVALFRGLVSAGADDYLVKPLGAEVLATVLDRPAAARSGTSDAGLGKVVVFMGSRGGVGTTTAAVSCAWLLAEERRETTALIDFDLHFGTVALKLDADPGNGLCEALEQPSRIDSLFIERAMVKVNDHLRVLAAEAPMADPLMIDAGAIDMLLHELRRKFTWIVVDLPRGATPLQRVVLAAANRAVLICERSLAGLRDTIRLQTLAREQAPQASLILVEAGAPGERAVVGKSEFEKGVGKPLDVSLSYDPKSAGEATNSGQPLPLAAPRSPVLRDLRQLVTALAGTAEKSAKRRLFALRSLW
ncbi:MAG TPA: cellulose synthase operon protein YhjQ/BcsQ [Stellaceae bacterium]|nr:cellulose synthase operon protein YhjQ/BcsQ [Stellaceae bacterium]